MKKSNIILKTIAEATVKSNVNSACCCWVFQPKMPKNADKFKKDLQSYK